MNARTTISSPFETPPSMPPARFDAAPDAAVAWQDRVVSGRARPVRRLEARADRHRLDGLNRHLNSEGGEDRVSAVFADAGDSLSLRKAFDGMSLVVVASSTSEHTGKVARAALEAKIDYLDVQYSPAKILTLRSMQGEIERANLCFITDGGFHPGMPAVMVHLGAGFLDSLESANVGSVIKIDWSRLTLSPATLEEFVGEFVNYKALHFKDGRWQKASALAMMTPRTMDFGGVLRRLRRWRLGLK